MQTRLSPSKTVDVSTGTADSDLSKLNAQRDMYKKDPIQRIYGNFYFHLILMLQMFSWTIVAFGEDQVLWL
jgi:hypothetical protein